MIVDTATVADFLNLTTRRVNELATQGVINQLARNQWDLKECVQKYRKYSIESNSSQYGLTEARAAKEQAEAELKKLLLAQKRGEVIEIYELEKALADIAATVSNRLNELANRVKRITPIDEVVYEAIANECEEIKIELKDAQIYKDLSANIKTDML
ncbi:MAG: hypothetical protein IJ965_08650 [Campylobacter sp.]|nr:hypothetical protein [Campylobacter sp.]MBR2430515.1 hypothetical protein [bacterium]